jgi:hypothetical protein
MKTPKECPDSTTTSRYDEDDVEMTDKEAVTILDQFLRRSYDKGHVYLGHDFEKLMQAIYAAITWYHMCTPEDK